MKRRREVIATVECGADTRASNDAFQVESHRSITLTIPDAIPSFAGPYLPLVRSYTPDVARALGEALVRAADAVEGASDDG